MNMFSEAQISQVILPKPHYLDLAELGLNPFSSDFKQ